MATPTGARHRDLEQRLRDMEAALRSLTGAALKRKQLSVTSGDFVVSGGGDVVIRDGGELRALYPNGDTAVVVGIFEGDNSGTWLQMTEEDGTSNVFQVYRIEPNGTYPGGYSSLVSAVDFLSVASRGTFLLSSPAGVSVSGGLVADDVTISPRGTTGSAANVRFNGSGRLLEVTSSRRFKADIKAAPDRADELLSVKGRTWRDRGEDADNTKQRHVGYIAEELHDAGLSEYVEYDDQGQPHAIQYDRLTVPLVQLAQRQQQQLDDQARKIARLSERLDALENPAPLP